MAAQHRALRNAHHVPERFFRGVGEIDRDAFFPAGVHEADAVSGQARAGIHCRTAQAVILVPAERHHAHATAVAVEQPRDAAPEEIGALDREKHGDHVVLRGGVSLRDARAERGEIAVFLQLTLNGEHDAAERRGAVKARRCPDRHDLRGGGVVVQTQKIDVVPAALTQGVELRQSVAVSVEIRDAVRQSHGDSLLFFLFDV